MNKELKENIMQGTLQAFNQKGLKFTMDDIAKILGISKKTIYQVFRDKDSLIVLVKIQRLCFWKRWTICLTGSRTVSRRS